MYNFYILFTEIKNIGIKNSTKNMYKLVEFLIQLKIEYNKYELFDTYFKWCCTK